MKTKSKKTIRIITSILAVAALSTYCSMLGGCMLLSLFGSSQSVMFTRSSLIMYEGDTYDLSAIIESNSDNYDLSVSPETVASINGTTLTAIKAGYATVTAETIAYSDTLSLTVKAVGESVLTISYSGELVQTMGSLGEITFTSKVSGAAADGIDWYVNDVFTETLSPSVPFKYTPSEVGEFVISARVGTLSASETVKVYNPVTASCTYSGELTQDAPFTVITFTATATENPLNPVNTFEWFVDGEKQEEVTGNVFSYTPTAGTHSVTLKVNGMSVQIDGRDYITVVCAGAIVPDKPTIEFDNIYPHVYLNHDASGEVCVEITPPSGNAVEYSQADPSYSDLFEDGRVDVGSLITLCATGTSRGAYKFRVKSLGDGGALLESDYSDALVFTQLPRDASKYISKQYCDKDYYITSEDEYVNVLEYEILSRTKVSNALVSFEVYIDFDMTGSAKELWNDAFPIAATSGSYSSINVNKNGNVMTTSFRVDTVNAPYTQTRLTHMSSEYSSQLHAIIPHINFDESKYRDEDYVFYVDTLEKTQYVRSTDELYFAVQNHSRPTFASAGSAAETVYNMARSVLRKICTDEMTDAQKAHAIYDWIMWQVTYDTPATTTSSSERLSAYYLEGVFGDGVTSIDRVVYEPYAVCDGMSKAYSLLCNMEGIPCLRIPGVAGKSLAEAGGHAWNKVYIDGEWYIVDCTWGDVTATVTIDGRPGNYELGIHDHLFITDAMVEGNHFETYQSGDTSIVYAPRTASTRYSVYTDYVINGTSINCEVLENENATSRLTQIAKSFAEAYTSRSTITVPGYRDGSYSLKYEGIEVYFPGGVTLSDAVLTTTVTSAIRSVRSGADVRVLALSNTVVILMDA